jgi:glycolate oxidase iron-sulfur subunit
VRVLTANGCEVTVPAGQTCCGALAVHAGLRDDGRALARKNIRAFLGWGAPPFAPAQGGPGDFDAIITNAAGCGATLKEYRELLAEDPEFAPRAAEFSGKMKDVTEFLAEVGLTQPLGRIEAVATYQDSCHLAHGQRVRAAPRELIRSVPGIEFRELPLSDICCGSAGVYNVAHNELAMSLLEKKMDAVRSTRAALLVTANPGCLLQLRAGVARWGNGTRVMHVVELLDESARASVSSGQ